MTEFEDLRPLLVSIAYGMMGSIMDAEDIVQEAYLRYREAEDVRHPQAFLKTVVTRLCLDHLKSAKVQREQYMGHWLPEPIAAPTSENNPGSMLQKADDLSIALLVLLEQLSPLERAAFLLREVFEYEYSEIGEILDRSEAACRKLYSRAKDHLGDQHPRFDPTPEQHQQILERFMQTLQQGEIAPLMEILTEDITVTSDGGGKVAAALHILHGQDVVARFFLGLVKKASGYTARIMTINQRPGMIVYDAKGSVDTVFAIQCRQGKIRAIYAIRNPDKLTHIPAPPA